jgi:5-methylcytosine-specific restriction enzyme subunit McrC
MGKPNRHRVLSVFEHSSLKLGDACNGVCFEESHLKALQRYYGEKGTPFFSLIHHGVKFCEYVGVINVGSLTIEVLPKADRSNDTELWRNVLIGMLKKVGTFNIIATSQAHLRIKSNHLLDLYFELFLNEVKALLHKGLIKKYRSTETNINSLKGTILFSKHLNANLVHQERFYVRNTVYDREHPLNQVLYKTILLIQKINCNPALSSRIGSLLLDFPVLKDIAVSDDWFNRLTFSRKTEYYRRATEIARLLLLNYHPDLAVGHNHVLALMFDMNQLWERFVFLSLRKHLQADQVRPQFSKPYWKLDGHRPVHLRPDIVITHGEKTFVIDTKWKLLNNNRPSDDDLRQMYAYTKYFRSWHTILCYPGSNGKCSGKFLAEVPGSAGYHFTIETIEVNANLSIGRWQEEICRVIEGYLNKDYHQFSKLE